MDSASASVPGTSSDSDWILLKRLEAAKHAAVAADIGVDAGTLSHFFNGKGGLKPAQLRRLLEVLGLKVVDAEARCVRPELFAEVTRLAGKLLTEAPQLMWDEK